MISDKEFIRNDQGTNPKCSKQIFSNLLENLEELIASYKCSLLEFIHFLKGEQQVASWEFYESFINEDVDKIEQALSVYPEHLLSKSEKLCLKLGLRYLEKE